jgi:hypothetical protein
VTTSTASTPVRSWPRSRAWPSPPSPRWPAAHLGGPAALAGDDAFIAPVLGYLRSTHGRPAPGAPPGRTPHRRFDHYGRLNLIGGNAPTRHQAVSGVLPGQAAAEPADDMTPSASSTRPPSGSRRGCRGGRCDHAPACRCRGWASHLGNTLLAVIRRCRSRHAARRRTAPGHLRSN